MSEQYIKPEQIIFCVTCDHFWHLFYEWGQSKQGTTCPCCGSGNLGGYNPDLRIAKDLNRLALLRQRCEQGDATT